MGYNINPTYEGLRINRNISQNVLKNDPHVYITSQLQTLTFSTRYNIVLLYSVSLIFVLKTFDIGDPGAVSQNRTKESLALSGLAKVRRPVLAGFPGVTENEIICNTCSLLQASQISIQVSIEMQRYRRSNTGPQKDISESNKEDTRL